MPDSCMHTTVTNIKLRDRTVSVSETQVGVMVTAYYGTSGDLLTGHGPSPGGRTPSQPGAAAVKGPAGPGGRAGTAGVPRRPDVLRRACHWLRPEVRCYGERLQPFRSGCYGASLSGSTAKFGAGGPGPASSFKFTMITMIKLQGQVIQGQ
eukprot:753843-Hanusia_phi.AAC.2